MQTKSAFEKDICFQAKVQEAVLDYVFSSLGIKNSLETNPIVMTEAYCIPNSCRALMNELLFECYSVPMVSYGVDSLFSFYNDNPDPNSTGLIINIHNNGTHVIPIIDGIPIVI